MMECCILCLEINKDILECIRADSTQWAEFNITKIIEKYFWTLNTTQLGSWICLSCWREIEGFHKFYLRIEEAHVNFGKIKVEELAVSVECQKELIPKSIKAENDKIDLCFLEPEILIDHTQQHEIHIDQHTVLDMIVEKDTTLSESLVESDMPLNQACKKLRSKRNLDSEDPLEKTKKFKKKRYSKEKFNAEEKTTENDNAKDSKVKEEPLDLNDNVSDSINDIDNITFQLDKDCSKSSESTKWKTCSKHRTSRKENDKFIGEHFKEMLCDLCQVQFKDFAAIKKHFTETHKQSGYVLCCQRKFFARTLLVDHLHCHLNPDYFKCKQCGKAMSDRISFDSHMLRVHRANEVVKPHCCDICGKSFTESHVLRIHKLTHLREDEKKFPCDDCGKNYGSPYLLNQHRQAVHLKRFVKICNICGRAINSREFKIHMNKHEGIPRPAVNCDVCGLRLTSERGLKLHKETQHPVGGKQEHHCPICPKISPTVNALKKHINTMHEKSYDHKCSFCEKAFKRSETLREHMATHTGTTLYTCPWCPKTFNSNGNMHAHRKKIHPKEWEESKLQKYSGHMIPQI